MRNKLIRYEIGFELIIAFTFFPILNFINEIYKQFFMEYPPLLELGLIGIFIVVDTVTMILGIIILHIPISFIIRYRMAKKRKTPIHPLKIAIITLIVTFTLYWLMSWYFFSYPNSLKSINFSLIIPPFVTIAIPPLLTKWIFGKTFEYTVVKDI